MDSNAEGGGSNIIRIRKLSETRSHFAEILTRGEQIIHTSFEQFAILCVHHVVPRLPRLDMKRDGTRQSFFSF